MKCIEDQTAEYAKTAKPEVRRLEDGYNISMMRHTDTGFPYRGWLSDKSYNTPRGAWQAYRNWFRKFMYVKQSERQEK